MKILIKFVTILFVLIQLGCHSKPIKPENVMVTKGPVRAKAKIQIKDLRKGDVHYIDVDILAQRDQRLRMDLRATLGILVASIAIQGNEIEYVVPQKKTMYSGAVSERSFKPLGSMQIHPKVFYSLIFDEPLHGGDWLCQKDPQGKPAICESQSLNSKVEWNDRNNGQLKVFVSSLTFEMTWILKSAEEDRSLTASDFNLKKPEGFNSVTIP